MGWESRPRGGTAIDGQFTRGILDPRCKFKSLRTVSAVHPRLRPDKEARVSGAFCSVLQRRPMRNQCGDQLAVAPQSWVTLGVRKPQPGLPSRNLDFDPGVVCLSTKVPEPQLWMTTLEMPQRLRVSADTHPPSAGLERGRLPPPSATPREQRSQTEGGDLSELVHTGSSILVLCSFGK